YVGDMLTLLVSTSGKHTAYGAGTPVETAQIEDLDEIVRCLRRFGSRHQFAPCWTREYLLSPVRSRGLRVQDFLIFRHGDRVAGCLACWDQRQFKQTVVRGYARPLAWARPVSNLLAPLTGTPKLPAVGESLAFAYASHLGIDNDDPRVFTALL